MSVKITWIPSPEPDIGSYDLERADNLSGAPWVLLTNVVHDLMGPAFDTLLQKFFYNDSTGDNTKFYRLIAIDLATNRSTPSTPFQATPTAPAIPNTVSVDHNYGSAGALRYQTAGGVPIEDAVIRVFKKADFDQGLTDVALATTRTNARGNWVSPIFLTTGFTYTILFEKQGLYGPDTREIVV
jgi:hypothetical protein